MDLTLQVLGYVRKAIPKNIGCQHEISFRRLNPGAVNETRRIEVSQELISTYESGGRIMLHFRARRMLKDWQALHKDHLAGFQVEIRDVREQSAGSVRRHVIFSFVPRGEFPEVILHPEYPAQKSTLNETVYTERAALAFLEAKPKLKDVSA